ncbi:MAG: hypothetical protein HOE69_08060 [Euryarchaeota archaeon]|jgi:hypothetical protein|nr:hypothetical protein [Euryarchaeota archaeon]
MADDVALQGEGAKTLHLKSLRMQWQVVALQTIATLALIWLYLQLGSNFGSCDPANIDSEGGQIWCPALDHTLTLDLFENILGSESGDSTFGLPIPDFLTGQGNEGPGRYYMPILLCGLITGAWVFLNLQAPHLRRKVILGVLLSLILFLAGRLLLGWFWGMLTNWDLYLPISADASRNHAETLVYPLILYSQFFIIALYLIPVWTGMMGIWGLSKRMIGWSLGTTLIYLGLHALLSFEAVTVYFDVGLMPISPQISDKMLVGGMVSETIWPLLLMAMLMILYSESGFAVIRYLEYAFRLPESCKKDPEYVTQFDNMLKGHLIHTVGIFSLVTFCAMMALKFDDLVLDLVAMFGSSQWSGQVQESLELQLTYGKVISAMLLLIFIAGMKYVLPWQKIVGFVESKLPSLTNSE